MKTLELVVPCYNEEKCIRLFYDEVAKVFADVPDVVWSVIFVNDGSKDETLSEIRSLASSSGRVKYISFSRNFGKEAAINAGLTYSTADYVALIDADL